MFETQFCKVEYLGNEEAVLCSWKKFCEGDDYRNPLLYGLDLIKDNTSKIWITDTSNGFENKEADTTWLIEKFMPELIESTCKEIIFILKKNSILRDEIEGQVKSLSKHFKVEIIESLDDIKES